MLRFALVVAVLAGSSADAAVTSWPRQCRGDIARTCKSVMQDDDKEILVCLQSHAKALSKSCQKLLRSYGHLPK